MTGITKIRALNDALESQNSMIEQYGTRERLDREKKVQLYNVLNTVGTTLNSSATGVEIINFPSLRTDELIRMKPHEITEAIAKWCSVASESLLATRKELISIYEELGMAKLDANLDRFNQLRTQANQAGIAANFRGLSVDQDAVKRPETPEVPMADAGPSAPGPVPIPSPPDSADGRNNQGKSAKKSTTPKTKTTTLDNILSGTGKTGSAPSKKK